MNSPALDSPTQVLLPDLSEVSIDPFQPHQQEPLNTNATNGFPAVSTPQSAPPQTEGGHEHVQALPVEVLSFLQDNSGSTSLTPTSVAGSISTPPSMESPFSDNEANGGGPSKRRFVQHISKDDSDTSCVRLPVSEADHKGISGTRKGVLCPHCTSYYSSKRTLDQHITENHSKVYRCHICRKEYHSPHTLNSHLVSAHPEVNQTFATSLAKRP